MSGGDQFDLICIGSGPAGESAARLAASWGYRVALIERERCPGGAMVNTGTVASKVLRETALLYSALRRRPLPGNAPLVDHSVSFERFLARTTLVQLEEHDRIELDLDRCGVEVIAGDARLDGEHRVHVTVPDGNSFVLHAEHILLAVGSRPNRPEDIDFTHPSIVDSTEILALENMPRSLTVVGGGVIGAEYASIFAEMGVTTTLIEPRSSILRFLDEECRETLIEQMASSGIQFKLGTQVRTARGLENHRAEVEFENGERLESDIVLWALGRSGNTENLGLETVGIETNDRGLIHVDEKFATHANGVWAAGDVIGFPALASASMEQARLAVANMFGKTAETKHSGLLPMSIYTIPAVAFVGPTETELREAGRNIVVGRAYYRRNSRGRMLGDDQGIVKLIFDLESKELLHATIVGEDATELIHIAMMAIASQWSIEDILSAPFTYPSLGEMYKSAARRASERLNIDHTRHNVATHSDIAA